MSEQTDNQKSEKQPGYFLLKAMIFPVLVVPAIVVTLLVLRGNEAEQLYYQALDLARDGQFEAAAAKFKRAGSMGHANSSYNLALLYSSGALDTPDAADQAEKYLRQAALNGSSDAEYKLGLIAEYAAAPNYQQAAMHYRKAALSGHSGGLTAMGRLHENGLGVNQSMTLAGEFYYKGAAGGEAESCAALGFFLLKNKTDIAEAEKYLQLAADQDHPKAMTALGYIYEQKNTPESQAAAIGYYRQAAGLHDPDGMVNYGDYLLKNGKTDEAVKLFGRASEEHNFAPALHRLGVYYFQQPQPDYERARMYFEKAAKKDHAVSYFNLGVMAEHGLGGKKDPVRASEYYSRAEKLGFKGSGTITPKLK